MTMSKHIRNSKRKVSHALSNFNKTIAKLQEANQILEQGVATAKKSYDDTCSEIKNLESKLDEYSVDLAQHESEIKKNNELISKFQNLTK
jgi:chromosome segregation ATPase